MTSSCCCFLVVTLCDLVEWCNTFWSISFNSSGLGANHNIAPVPVEQRIKWLPPLQWRQNERDGVLYHRRLYCLLNRLFRHRSKKASKLRVTGLWVGDLTGTGEFPAQKASNAENVSIWWRHHDLVTTIRMIDCEPCAYFLGYIARSFTYRFFIISDNPIKFEGIWTV